MKEKENFRKNINKYVRQYSFISQIITFIDINLEKFYLFTKLLSKICLMKKKPCRWKLHKWLIWINTKFKKKRMEVLFLNQKMQNLKINRATEDIKNRSQKETTRSFCQRNK